MVNFRYHIVSIIAVFLALALGIVLGSYTINPQVVKNLRSQVHSLRNDKSGLRGQVLDLQRQVSRGNDFVQAVMPELLAGRLEHQRVVIVRMPSSSSGIANDVGDAVAAAGGKVAATVTIDSSWVDPTSVALLGDLSTRLAVPGTVHPGGNAYVRAARVLASALMGPPHLTSAQTTILAGFSQAKLLDVSDNPLKGTVAVVVAADGVDQPTDADTAATGELLAIPTALDAEGRGAVVVGPAAADNGSGLVRAVRSDDASRVTLSSVDDGGTTTGTIRTVLALAAEARGVSGQYGIAGDASGQAPTPSPTPSP